MAKKRSNEKKKAAITEDYKSLLNSGFTKTAIMKKLADKYFMTSRQVYNIVEVKKFSNNYRTKKTA